jgi:hypothetical protein
VPPKNGATPEYAELGVCGVGSDVRSSDSILDMGVDGRSTGVDHRFFDLRYNGFVAGSV